MACNDTVTRVLGGSSEVCVVGYPHAQQHACFRVGVYNCTTVARGKAFMMTMPMPYYMRRTQRGLRSPSSKGHDASEKEQHKAYYPWPWLLCISQIY